MSLVRSDHPKWRACARLTPPWCLPPSCVALRGNRRGATDLERLLLGDLVWLFFFERMGIFKILGVILDDLATRGGFPISNGAIDTTSLKDDVIAWSSRRRADIPKPGSLRPCAIGMPPIAACWAGPRTPVGHPGPGQQGHEPAVPQVHARRDQLQQREAARNRNPGHDLAAGGGVV